MSLSTDILFTLTLLLCGGYAGMTLMCCLGILPAMQDLSLSAFADAWRAMDSYMARTMPPYKGALLILNLATVILLVVQHRTSLAVASGISLLCSLAGLVLTVHGQLPLNARIKAIPAGTSVDALPSIRERTVRGFRVRCYLATTAFVVLCVGVVFAH